MADLADRGHVDRVVESAVPAPRQSVHSSTARGVLDGCGAVVGSELITVGEPADVAGVADQGTRDGRADTEQVSQRRVRCVDGVADPLV
jgi:hypothetical protein